jgi:hypothetical protein
LFDTKLKIFLFNLIKTTKSSRVQIIKALSNDKSMKCEPYTTYNLDKMDIEYISDPLELNEININFSDRDFLIKYCQRNESLTFKKQFQKSNTAKQLDGFAVWFELWLDEDTMVTNCPKHFLTTDSINDCKSKSWHQAVFFNRSMLETTQSDLIEFEVVFNKDYLTISQSFNIPPPLIVPKNDFEINLDLNCDEISRLNNDSYQLIYTNWFRRQQQSLSSLDKKIRIALLTDSFSSLLFELFFIYKRENMEIYIFMNEEQQSKNNFKLNLHNYFPNSNFNYKIVSIDDEFIIKSNLHLIDFDFIIAEPLDIELGNLRKNFFSDLEVIQKMNPQGTFCCC